MIQAAVSRRGARTATVLLFLAGLQTTLPRLVPLGPWIGNADAQGLPVSPPLPPVPPSGPGAGPEPGGDEPMPPYEPQLERLSELLGTLTYMWSLCGKGDAGEWRERMTALLDAEAKGPSRRQRLAGAFNRGFRGYEATYRTCTPSADLVITRDLAESDRLARDLATRFSGT